MVPNDGISAMTLLFIRACNGSKLSSHQIAKCKGKATSTSSPNPCNITNHGIGQVPIRSRLKVYIAQLPVDKRSSRSRSPATRVGSLLYFLGEECEGDASHSKERAQQRQKNLSMWRMTFGTGEPAPILKPHCTDADMRADRYRAR